MFTRYNRLGTKTLLVSAMLGAALGAQAAWEAGTRFTIGEAGLVAPDGKPFKSAGIVWAYGPERGPLAKELTAERVVDQLKVIKDLGFNTLNLYGDRFIPEMLAWCDENELAVYFRTACLPPGAGEYPDYLDPELRHAAKANLRKLLDQVKGHPSVLAVDTDHRWLFPLDWTGAVRVDVPQLGPKAIEHFPVWLEEQYGDIAKLNAAWETDYRSFGDVRLDGRLIVDGKFRKLGRHPGRADIVRYTLWTATDFLDDLAGYAQSQVPGLLVTPTTEHPECLPDVNPDPAGGVAFMSPVHYNAREDFGRDLAGLCKLVCETRWHFDLQGRPVYVSETGLRTSTLEQKPPVTSYAWAVPPDEATVAKAYALETSLLNVLPWIGGWGWFKLYDKWPEGDFGYLRDDGSKKPLALVGDAINEAFEAAVVADPEPEAWIYYPDYALASEKPGFQQLKTWVAIWEQPFLRALEGRVEQFWEGLSAGDPKTGRKFANSVTRDFRRLWRGFAFTRTIPDDDRPVVLLSTISGRLTSEDRAALRKKKTVTFGPVGTADEFMRETAPWYLDVLGLKASDVRESYYRVSLSGPSGGPVEVDSWDAASSSLTNSPWVFVQARDYERGLPARGQAVEVPPGRYTRLEILAGSVEGNAAPSLEVEYAGGTPERLVMGPTISDMRFKPELTGGVAMGDRFLSRIVVPLEAGRDLQRVHLPDAPWVRLFGLVLVSGGPAADVHVSLPVRGGDVTGITPWMLALPADGKDLQVLKPFSNDQPAIVARGTHAAFLFDPLTWAGRKDEISVYVDLLHHDWFEPVFKYLRGAKAE